MSFKPTVKLAKSKDGTTIYAEAVGDPSKQSIVFLHGFALSGASFDGLFSNPQLLEHFYLVRIHFLLFY
jgi:pimeloyl-ACP methyl ester carboxylesterase